jgi:Transcriptional regulators
MKAKLIDVAKLAGVSRTTAFRALRGQARIKPSTVERVLLAAKQLDYQPNRHASALRSNQSMIIGVLFSNLFSGHFYAEIYQGIETIAYKEGYTLLLGSADEDRDKEEKLISLLLENSVDGVIAAPLGGADGEKYSQLLDQGIPIVFVDKFFADMNRDRVITDNYQGGRLAADYLLELGHRRIATCKGNEPTASSVEDRTKGFSDSLLRYGVKTYETIDFANTFGDSREGAYEATMRYLRAHPPAFTALFAQSDSIATGCISALIQCGYRVPEDISVVGYNDDKFSRFFPIPLTTVAQHKYEMGEKAIQLLLNQIRCEASDEPRSIILQPELIIRASCARWEGEI